MEPQVTPMGVTPPTRDEIIAGLVERGAKGNAPRSTLMPSLGTTRPTAISSRTARLSYPRTAAPVENPYLRLESER